MFHDGSNIAASALDNKIRIFRGATHTVDITRKRTDEHIRNTEGV
jgi:hypothetical protein